MSLLKSLAVILLAILFGLPTSAAQPGAKTQARLIVSADAIKPGDALMAGIHLKMPERWHTYWKNPGEAGIATKVEWTLPEGVGAGEIQWPLPQKLLLAGIAGYGYSDEVVLLVPLKVSNGVAGPIELKAKVTWLECDTLCVRGMAEITNTVKIEKATHITDDASLLFDWQKKVPQQNPDRTKKVRASWEGAGTAENRSIIIEWNDEAALEDFDFYNYPAKDFDMPGKTDVLSKKSPAKLRKVVNKLEGAWPKEISGVILASRSGAKEPEFFEVTIPISQNPSLQPSPVGRGGGSLSPQNTPPANIWAMLGLAFLGGLILNIMPCVLPVIALKVLGFVQQSKESPGRVKKMGLLYALGVIVSFVALAVMIIAAQHAGGLASWGMQMQNPQFRAVMTVVVILVALNLFGLFEVNLGGSTMDAAGKLASKEGYAGAFFNGVLATALATPCTAPFLTVALGFAFTQSPLTILLMFVVTAIGLASPYVLLSWNPGGLRFLPKPGAWMEKFKIAMGFPMLATAIWMFDLSVDSFGESGTLWFGIFLVVLALSAWIWGEFVQRGSVRKGLAGAVAVLLVAGSYAYAMERELHWRHPTPRKAAGAGLKGADGIEWVRWSVAAVEEARSQGHPVLVDFTAKWCFSCKANERTSLKIPAVRDKLKEIDGVAMIADNTDIDPEINAELRKYGRAGVPLVLVFPKDKSKLVNVLPTLLTPRIVLDALDEAAK